MLVQHPRSSQKFRVKFNRGSLKRRAIITNYLESQNNDVPPRAD